ncbi:MAG: hypothetical protein PHG66_00030 [Candidatus Colwellbacteria bacterium]|nr:hypothetical protein [Candidatus Colwellbacteria bacterium]
MHGCLNAALSIIILILVLVYLYNTSGEHSCSRTREGLTSQGLVDIKGMIQQYHANARKQ